MLTPILGKVLDKVGLLRFYIALTIVYIAFCVTVLIPSFPIQVLSIILGIVYLCAWIDFLGKWAALFAPPDLLGTYFGIVFSVAGLSQLAVNLTVPAALETKYGGRMQYLVVFYAFGGVSVLFSVALAIVIWRRGVPSQPLIPRSRQKSGGIN